MLVSLIVPDADRRRILVDSTRNLPVLDIEPWDFMPSEVERINAGARQRYGLDATTLRHLADSERQHAVELELHSPHRNDALSWSDLETLASATESPLERQALERLGRPANSRLAPWEHRGWYESAADWFKSVVPVERLCQTKGAWPRSAILRGEGKAGVFYLKTDNPKPPFEGDVIDALGPRWRGRLPELVGIDAPQRRFIMKKFHGERLSGDLGPNKLSGPPSRQELAAVAGFAEIQTSLSNELEALEHLGCPRLEADQLFTQARDLFDDALVAPGPWAMTADERERARALLPSLGHALAELANCGIPLSLHNEDFRSGNIARTPSGFVYFDWSEVAVSYPIFSMLYYLYRRGRPPGARYGAICSTVLPRPKCCGTRIFRLGLRCVFHDESSRPPFASILSISRSGYARSSSNSSPRPRGHAPRGTTCRAW